MVLPLFKKGEQRSPNGINQRFPLRLLPVLLLLCLATPLTGWVDPALALPKDGPAPAQEFIGTRPFKGLVRQDLAESAARAAVTIYAIEQGMRDLVKHPDMQFASASRQQTPLGDDELAGLVRMLYTITATRTGVEGFPPEMHALVQMDIAPRDDLRARLYYAMTHREHLGIYSRIHEQQKHLLEEYDALAPTLLRISHEDMTGKEKLLDLQSLLQRIAALEKFEALLPGLTDRWENPAEAQTKLERLLKADPHNPLYLTALAETLIQLDRPAEAQGYAAEAVTRQPDYARAHDIYGTILLRRRLPALAAKAFGEAIALAPALAEYRLHRAAAFLVQEEIEAMCQDLHTACVYGQCEQYEWARDTGKCAPPQPAPQEPPLPADEVDADAAPGQQPPADPEGEDAPPPEGASAPASPELPPDLPSEASSAAPDAGGTSSSAGSPLPDATGNGTLPSTTNNTVSLPATGNGNGSPAAKGNATTGSNATAPSITDNAANATTGSNSTTPASENEAP